ncbi:MAG: rubrerythrin [Hyphomicrobiales bacterium]|nr:MAG: rubrerythrin [Hyphomicrobiales bacterium]
MLQFTTKRRFSDLNEAEILSLAISAEEEDGRIYGEFADAARADYPSVAEMFDEMAAEENEHRRWLIDTFDKKYGTRLPPIKREDVAGFIQRKPWWVVRARGVEAMRSHAADMEAEAQTFYLRAAERSRDTEIRKLLGDLAEAERHHEHRAEELEGEHLTEEAIETEDAAARRRFLLQVVQPGLAGLMDGSVSTLAPLFAAAFATQNNWETFLVGLAASVGAGISMGFAEALSDDGSLTGRGSPWIRGFASGIMTTVGGIGHTLPYLIPAALTMTLGGIAFSGFGLATLLAVLVVIVELWAIAWIRWKYMDTPFLAASFQIVIGGVLVFLAGIIIGNA